MIFKNKKKLMLISEVKERRNIMKTKGKLLLLLLLLYMVYNGNSDNNNFKNDYDDYDFFIQYYQSIYQSI